MKWRDVVRELTSERGPLTGNHADVCPRLYMRGWVILISGVLFCCSFVSVGVPVVSIGALLIHMANKQACQPTTLAMYDTAFAVIQQANSTSILINCMQCGASDLIPITTFMDRFADTATANPPEKIQRFHRRECGHGFMELQIAPTQKAARKVHDKLTPDELYTVQIGSVSVRVEVLNIEKLAATRTKPAPSARADRSSSLGSIHYGRYYWAECGDYILRVRVIAKPTTIDELYHCQDAYGKSVFCPLSAFLGPATPILISERSGLPLTRR